MSNPDDSNLNKPPTLCLNMIVKNESAIIERMLESVSSIIDTYCICDTGSTDNTIDVITSFFSKKNIPGTIVCEPFQNFAHNRNFAMQSCMNMSDYILLMDADMKLDIKNFDKNILSTADTFNILQGNDDFYYQNVRIVKNNGLFKYLSVTHEYVSSPPNTVNKELTKDQLFILDLGDGGCKTNKYERDIALLTEGIKNEPNNERYHFYLANSYYDTGRHDEAISTYKKRIELGGWQQEIWYSYYRIGLCYKSLNKMDEAVIEWLNGYNCLPDRLENLYEIIQHYRLVSKQKLSEMFYFMAKRILDKKINRDSFLFLHNDIYSYKLYYEYTIISYYNNVKNINDEIIAVLNNSNDHNTNTNLLTNMKFYKFVLKSLKTINLTSAVTKNINEEYITFNSSSSCLVPNKNNDGYLMNMRYVNYFINDGGSYLNCDKYIITHNKFYELKKNFEIISEKWLETEFEDRRYIGIEDIRIFYENDDLLFIGTGYHKSNKIGIVNGKYDVSTSSKLISNEMSTNFSNSDCEKNWVYVNYKDKTNIIYKWSPLQICEIDAETNVISLVESKGMPKIFNMVRGSTCGFNYKKSLKDTNVYLNNGNIELQIEETEIWFVLHIVSYETPRHYYHLIAVFDESMNLLRYSAPFKFEENPIEYCLSLVVEDERVLINYSTWDRTTKIGIYDKKYIEEILKYN